ncbi:hypothetical protein [Rhodopila sp.]|uniref:hypothetical protein n=1 Tax=Rhodopila sp. TaxID=2480087 RepID=UPI003D10BA7C
MPILSRGDDWVFAQNIAHVVNFLGLNEATGPVLSPIALKRRLDLFLATAILIVPQMPDRLLATEVPNRPRSYLALGHHLFRIPEGVIEVARGATLDNAMLTGGPPPEMNTGAALAGYGQQVQSELNAWWHDGADHTGAQTVRTYYGPQTLHEVMERTTWHCGQHVRQWFMLLRMVNLTPVATLDAAAFADLPMPTSVWDG